ncbi:MAG: hypothetical protein ACT4N4_09070 [Rhodospirillales bacterium]
MGKWRNSAFLGALALLAGAGLAMAQSGQGQQAQAGGARAILGEWSFLCNAPQHLGFAEDTAGKLKRYYIREGKYRTDEESIASYAEDKGFIRMKFASGEELTYKRQPEGIKEWFRRLPGQEPMTRDGKTHMPVLKTLIDTPIFQRCK